MIILFEGRGRRQGRIDRLTERLEPQGMPGGGLGHAFRASEKPNFPSAGEIVVFDRSWYNRAGVEKVMGFATREQVEQFYVSCPQLLVQDGILLLKYWFSINDDEQEKRFQERIDNEERRWKMSPMDIESRNRWVEYSKAKDTMFAKTHIPEAPWFTVEANDKRRARLNCLRHILSKVPYEDMTPPPIKMPKRPKQGSYKRPPFNEQFFVPQLSIQGLRKQCAKEKSNKFRSTISLGCFNQAALFHAKNNYFYVHLLK